MGIGGSGLINFVKQYRQQKGKLDTKKMMGNVFWDDPRVLTVSVHEGPRTLFPGTGHPEELGGPGALGTAVNVALPAGTDAKAIVDRTFAG